MVAFYGFPQGDMEPDWSKMTASIRGHMAEHDDFFPPAAARALCPAVERWADQLPARRLGVFGALLLCLGFLLDSIEYWLTLFDVAVR